MIGAVALIYSFNSLVFSEAISSLMGQASGTDYTAMIIIAFSLIIAFILGWFVSYMMNFILRKRSQELSTYMLLGIEKKQISRMFFTENIAIGIAALLFELVLGFLLAEILNAMLTGPFGGTYSLSSGFSLQAVGLHCCTSWIYAIRQPQYIWMKQTAIYSRKSIFIKKTDTTHI